jgi:hypothetical protein
MSNPPNGFNTNSNFNKFKGTYFNSDVDVSGGNIICRNGNIFVAPNSYINSPTNAIVFDDTYAFTNFSNNVHIFGIQQIDYGGVVYDVGSLISQIGTMTYYQPADFNIFNNIYCAGQIQYLEAGTGNHVDLVGKVLQNISDTATKVDLTTAQTVGGVKTFSSPPIMSGASITTGTIPTTAVSGGICDLTNPQTLAGIKTFSSAPVLSGASITSGTIPAASVVGTAMVLTGAQTVAGIKTFSNPPVMSGASITSNTIPLASIVGSVCDLASPQTLSGIKTFSAVPVFSSNLRLDGSLLLNAGALTLTNANLQKIQFLSTVSSDIQTQTTSNGTSITTLNTKTTGISYSAPTTTIAGTTAMTNATLTGNLVINNGLTTYTNAQLLKINNILTSTSDLQTQINNFNGVGLNGNNTYTGVQTYNGNIVFSALLNNVTSTTFSYISGLTSSAQTQLDNKGGLGVQNNWTNGNTFSGQLASSYNAGSALVGSPTELFVVGQKYWDSGGSSSNGSNVFSLSLDTGFIRRGLEIQGGESNTLTGVGQPSRSIFGLYFRQYQVTGGPLRIPILYGEDSETGAINNTLVCPSSLRLDGSLKVGTAGGTTITNTQLGYLSSLSSNVQSAIDSHTTSITSLTTKTTNISFSSTPSSVTSIANKLQTSVLAFSSTLNGITSTVFNYISGLTSDLATTLTSITNRQQIGSIMQHPKGNIGSPYLLANGQAVSRTTYSVLFASYGTLYGSGDGGTTFNLPNFQACFLRSYGAGVTIGSSTYTTAAVGSAQNDAIQGHNHSPPSGTYLNTSTQSTTTNGLASVAILKSSSNTLGNTGGVINANSGAETVPTHHVVYTYILAL